MVSAGSPICGASAAAPISLLLLDWRYSKCLRNQRHQFEGSLPANRGELAPRRHVFNGAAADRQRVRSARYMDCGGRHSRSPGGGWTGSSVYSVKTRGNLPRQSGKLCNPEDPEAISEAVESRVLRIRVSEPLRGASRRRELPSLGAQSGMRESVIFRLGHPGA